MEFILALRSASSRRRLPLDDDARHLARERGEPLGLNICKSKEELLFLIHDNGFGRVSTPSGAGAGDERALEKLRLVSDPLSFRENMAR